MNYLYLNLVLLVIAAAAAITSLREWRQVRLVLQTSILVTLLSYPWDFFTLQLESWHYSDPGPRLFHVPMNDIALIFLCTFISASVFARSDLQRK
jgi:hypothetical protein